MNETVLDLAENCRAVGVVKRGDAPLVEKLLAENEHPSYEVALPDPSLARSIRRWIPDLSGVPLIVSLFSLLDTARVTR